ncbi:MAG: quinoprotein dehydrogenase-associated SoxYZ-like carrier [Pseudomonadota bacterium]
MKIGRVIAALAAMLIAAQAHAGETWDELRPAIFGDAVPVVSPDIVTLHAPYRTYADPRTDVGARITAPFGEFIRIVSLIIDENPMPVSAVFELAEPQREFAFSTTMRINGPSMVRVVAETDGGKFYMQEAFLKTSGVGACSAPPGTDPIEALASLGTMNFKLLPTDSKTIVAGLGKAAPLQSSPFGDGRAVQLDIDHPSHSGMQMDQITLLFIPMRYVETVEVETDGKPAFTMTGSISFSENPAVRFDIPADSVGVGVKMTDTDGAVFEENFSLPGG